MQSVFSISVAILLTAFTVRSTSAQEQLNVLTNADVVRLVGMGVPDLTVITVINDAKATQLDLNPRAVNDLADHGVSAAVIAAMGQPSTPMLQSTSLPSSCPVPRMLTTPTATKPATHKFDRVYAAGKAVDVAARSIGGIAPGNFQQLLFALEVELSFVQDQVITGAEVSLLSDYALAAAQFRLGLATYLTPGQRYSDWTYNGIDRMEIASNTLNDANKIYLGK
jgi:hypothetical protein